MLTDTSEVKLKINDKYTVQVSGQGVVVKLYCHGIVVYM